MLVSSLSLSSVVGMFRQSCPTENRVYLRVSAVACVALAALSICFRDLRYACGAAIAYSGAVMHKLFVAMAADLIKAEANQAKLEQERTDIADQLAAVCLEKDGAIEQLTVTRRDRDALVQQLDAARIEFEKQLNIVKESNVALSYECTNLKGQLQEMTDQHKQFAAQIVASAIAKEVINDVESVVSANKDSLAAAVDGNPVEKSSADVQLTETPVEQAAESAPVVAKQMEETVAEKAFVKGSDVAPAKLIAAAAEEFSAAAGLKSKEKPVSTTQSKNPAAAATSVTEKTLTPQAQKNQKYQKPAKAK